MGNLIQDLRYAIRLLRRSPGFAVVVLLTLALGIGASTAIFSVAYSILLKPLPYPNESRLVSIWASETAPKPWRTTFLSVPEVNDIQAQSNIFDQIAEYESIPLPFIITGQGTPEPVAFASVSGDFFAVLGVPPILGRPILPADAEPGHENVAVLSYAFWQKHFGGDPGVVGKNVVIEGQLTNVVGVMPPLIHFPASCDVWMPIPPLDYAKEHRNWRFVAAIARLREGTTLTEANAQLHVIAARLAKEHPSTDSALDLSVGLLRDQVTEGYSRGLFLLFGAVSFLLLLAAVNVSSLLVAKNWTRQKEVAIRETLGATRSRLIRQFFAESIFLGLSGGALGFLLAYWGVHLLRSLAPSNTPRLDEVALNLPVLLYTLSVSIVSGILFGLAPALHIARPELGATLKKVGTSAFFRISLQPRYRLQNLLIVVEIALAFVLVIGATLSIRSFSKLTHVNLGYRTDHVLTMGLMLSTSTCPPALSSPDGCNLALSQILERIRTWQGVESAGVSSARPLSDKSATDTVQMEGESPTDVNERPSAESLVVTPEYFPAMGIHLLTGRLFTDQDRKNSSLVAVVNEEFAKRYFNGNPLGRRFSSGNRTFRENRKTDWIEIVGEVANTRDVNPSQKPDAEFYTPWAQELSRETPNLVVRTAGNPLALANIVRHQVWSVDKDAAISSLETMDQVVSESVADPRFRTILLSAFGGLGLVLALVGIYGLISYAVSQRTHEIGVRMAFGAQPNNIRSMVVSEAMLLVALGIFAGAGGALALTRVLRSIVFQIEPADPATYVGVALLMTVVALAACLIPAYRAARVDPMSILRYE